MFERLFPSSLLQSVRDRAAQPAGPAADDLDQQDLLGNQALLAQTEHTDGEATPQMRFEEPQSEADAFLEAAQAAAVAEALTYAPPAQGENGHRPHGARMYTHHDSPDCAPDDYCEDYGDRTPLLDTILIETGLRDSVEELDELSATHPVDLMFCGRFVTWLYGHQGFDLEANGGRLSSDRKALNYFMYRDHHDDVIDPDLQARHEAQGSARQLLVLQGSAGDEYFQHHGERYDGDVPTAQPVDENLDIRPGDTVIFRGHVAMVTGFDPETRSVDIVEGNYGEEVHTRTLDLTDEHMLSTIQGFGRLAAGDFGYEGEEEQAAGPLLDDVAEGAERASQPRIDPL